MYFGYLCQSKVFQRGNYISHDLLLIIVINTILMIK